MADIETTAQEDVQGVEQEIIDEVLADSGEETKTDEGGQQAQSAPSQTGTQQKAPAAPSTTQQPNQVQSPPPGYVPYDALHAERQQRQQVQNQLNQLAQQFADLQKQQQQVKTSTPDPNADPLASMIAAQLEKVMPQFMTPIQQMQQQFQQFRQMQQQQEFQQRVIQSDAQARAKYADYDDVIAPVKQRAQMDPNFAKTLLSMPDPGEYAYVMALGMQAQAQKNATGQAQVQKMQQMAAMPRSSQINSSGGGVAPQFNNLEDMVDNFDKLTPAQQDRLLKMTSY
jgi:hypothetical protein